MRDQSFPEPTVGAFIFNPEGKLLLVRSHKWHAKWVVPGGHLELGETLEQAMIRETLEETGLAVTGVEFINYQEFIYDAAFWKPRHFIFFDFSCQSDGSVVVLNDEAEEYTWAEPEEALRMEIDAYTRTSLQVLMARPHR